MVVMVVVVVVVVVGVVIGTGALVIVLCDRRTIEGPILWQPAESGSRRRA